MESITIKDIARETGLSTATVSRVINDNYPVSTETRKKVLDAIDKLNYSPNAIARSLRAKRSNLVALIVADLSNQFFMDAAKGLEEVIGEAGYSLVIASSDGNEDKENDLIKALYEKQVDGFCIASASHKPDVINRVIEGGKSVVLIDRNLNGVKASKVLWNDFETAQMLTQMLIDKGHREIAVVNVTLTHQTGTERLRGYKETMKKARLKIPKSYVSGSNFSSEEAHDFVRHLLEKPDRPTAIVCCNNVMAEGSIKAIMEAGLEIGKDISLVSFGRLDYNNYLKPTITTARLDSRQMGRRAGSILMDAIENQNKDRIEEVIIGSTLVPGGSIVQMN